MLSNFVLCFTIWWIFFWWHYVAYIKQLQYANLYYIIEFRWCRWSVKGLGILYLMHLKTTSLLGSWFWCMPAYTVTALQERPLHHHQCHHWCCCIVISLFPTTGLQLLVKLYPSEPGYFIQMIWWIYSRLSRHCTAKGVLYLSCDSRSHKGIRLVSLFFDRTYKTLTWMDQQVKP